MNRSHYILFVLLVWANLLFAQSTTFTAQVNSTTVGAGEQFQIDFSLNGNGDRFSAPTFSGFEVLSGPNVSQSMTSINGNTTSSNAYSYILAAPKEGDYTIGSASIYVNGRILTTRPIRIHVTKGTPQNRRAIQQQQQQMQADVDDAKPSSDMSKKLFIRAVVDKSNVYQGEQLSVTYRLYTRVGILQSQMDKLPDLNGFWSQDTIDPKQQQQVQWKTEILNGTRYNVADLKQAILFPEHSGNLTIDPMGMTFIVREQAAARDIMEQFFGGAFRDVKVKVKSIPVTVHVKPLPEAGKPIDYSGAVGTFVMDASVDKKSLKANETLNYNIKITGAGNIKLFKPLSPAFPTDFEKYDPKVTDTINKGTRISGSRLYNFLLIPRHAGNYTIDPVKFTYFNPATRRYITLTSKLFQISVAKGAAETNVSTLSAADKQDVKLLDKDIRYIKTGEGFLNKRGDTFFGSVLYYILLLLGPIIFIVALIYRRWYEKQNSDIVKVRSRKASKVAAKHLANAKLQLSGKNSKGFYEALFKGIYGYLSDKLNIPYATLDKETIATALKQHSVNENLITQLQDTLDLCDMARFSPMSGIAEQDVFEKAKNTINDIEDEI